VIVFGYRRRDELSRLFSSVKLPGGFEFTFRGQLETALEQRGRVLPEASRSKVLSRATRNAAVTQGARILWVDDDPERNLPERKLLRSLGIMIDLARSTDEGIDALGRADFDAAISNMSRAGRGDEGARFIERVPAGLDLPVVLYILNLDPSRGTPRGAIGITNTPDGLVHLVLDALERERG
jgi:hypothetical protein